MNSTRSAETTGVNWHDEIVVIVAATCSSVVELLFSVLEIERVTPEFESRSGGTCL